jgi:hypothetical protein
MSASTNNMPHGFKQDKAMSYKVLFIIGGIDWTSVKVTLAFSIPAFISGANPLQLLGFVSVGINIIYNAYRLYLLHKNRNKQ